MIWTRKAGMVGALPLVVALGACDLLTITDPGRWDDKDLDKALNAVANSVEGSAHDWADWYVIWQELLGDTYMHTGRFYTTFGLIDEGGVAYGTYPTTGSFNNFPDHVTRHGWFAEESWNRLVRLDSAELETDVRSAQVLLGDALLEMYLGLFSCEGVLDAAPSEMRADLQIYASAAEKFGRAVEVAQKVDPEVLEDYDADYINAARTGRAFMLMLIGDYEGAVAEAAAVPDGFSYEAIHSRQTFSQWNYVVLYGSLYRYVGLMPWLWERVDQTSTSSFIKDHYYTDEFDQRMPAWFRGWISPDGETPHYMGYKYGNDYAANIPILHSDHARLIEAEAKVMANDYAGATAILNNLRSRVGLGPLPVAATHEIMMDNLLNERFAELYMEGMRMVDLHRFGLVLEIFEDFEDELRPGVGRATKFPGSKREAQLNTMVEDNVTVRCQPAA